MAKSPLLLMGSLRVFETVARLQSMSKAGQELHIAHSAVSRRIKDLERQIGRNLFERRNRSIVLNGAGRILFDAVATGFDHIQRAVVQLGGTEGGDSLVISVDPDFAGLWLVPHLAEFYAVVPNTLVDVRVGKAPLAIDDPAVSCVIQYAEVNPGRYGGDLLFRSQLFPVCAGSLLYSRPLNSVDDLRHHNLIHDRTTREWREYFARYASTVPVDFKLDAVFSENSLCLDAAARGLGVAMGDDCLAAQYLAEGRLVRPFEAAVLSRNAYYLVVAEKLSTRRSVASFRQWLLASFARRREQSIRE